MSVPGSPDDAASHPRFGVRRAAGGARGLPAAGLLPTFLLHGIGGSLDEVIFFGGIGLMLAGLLYRTWRNGKKNRRERRRGRRR